MDPVTFVLSPTLIKSESSPTLKGSRPDKRSFCFIEGVFLGEHGETASLIALICSGVVPQQPPTILTQPSSANSAINPEVISGVSSNPVGAIGFGNPALGYIQIGTSHML